MPRLNPISVTLHHRAAPPRLDCGQLRLEPAITALDWLFTPSPRLEKPMHGELLQASTRFYPRFTLPRVRSSGFGSCASDSWRFHTTPLVNCGLLVSLRLPDVSAVSLATHTHSLARYSKRTMHTRTCASYYSSTISRAFHSLRRVLFSVPSRYYSLSDSRRI